MESQPGVSQTSELERELREAKEAQAEAEAALQRAAMARSEADAAQRRLAFTMWVRDHTARDGRGEERRTGPG